MARVAKELQTLALLSLLVLLAGCGGGSSDDGPSTGEQGFGAPNATRVEVVKLERGPIASFQVASGNTRALRNAPVYARIGAVCLEVLVREGDPVTEGQVLARLDDRRYSFERAGAEALLLEARARLGEAEHDQEKAARDYARIKRLYDNKSAGGEIFSQEDVDAARITMMRADASLDAARATYMRAEADFGTAELNYENTTIRSPINGTVIKRSLEAFDLVMIDRQVFVIAELEELILDVGVPEPAAPLIRKPKRNEAGEAILSSVQAVLLSATAFAGQRFVGYVDEVSPAIDDESGMMSVRIRVLNAAQTLDQGTRALLAQIPPREKEAILRTVVQAEKSSTAGLRPGMWMEAHIVTRTKSDVVLLPTTAIVSGSVFVVDEKPPETAGKIGKVPARVHRISVERLRGIEGEGWTELLLANDIPVALNEGSLVVVRGQEYLRDGSPVRIVNLEKN